MSALAHLAQYTDSDDDEHNERTSPSPRKKRKSETRHSSGDEDYGLLGLKHAERRKYFDHHRRDTPEAPRAHRNFDDDASQSRSRFSDDERWQSPEADDRDESAIDAEPPPPAPRHIFHSPSGSPSSSQANTPVKRAPRGASKLAMVNYSIDD